MQLSNGRVVIRFAHPDGAAQAAQHELGSLAAERQCRAHIARHDLTDRVSVRLDRHVPAPVTEVIFEEAFVEQLPLLREVQDSTDAAKGSHVQLPCSSWGLVSLLILLEGSVGVEEWFGGDPETLDASLPGHTLQVRLSMMNIASVVSWVAICSSTSLLLAWTLHQEPAL